MGEIGELYTGNSIAENIKKTKYMNLKDGYDYIGTKDVSFDKKVNYNNGVKIPFEEKDFLYAYENDILLCIEGGSAGRKIAILNKQVCFGNKLCCIHSYINNNLQKYIYYFLQSPIFISIFNDNLSGIIGGVSIGNLRNLLIPLPPLQEQKRIVEKVERIMEKVEEIERCM